MTTSFYRSRYSNDTEANGGRLALSSYGISFYIRNGQKNNLLPDVINSEVLSGFERYRKFFLVAEYDIAFLEAYLAYPSSAMDNVLIHAATPTDTQAEADDYTQWKGAGLLKNLVLAGDISFMVVTSENEGEGFNPGDLLRIADDDNNDFLRIKSVSWSGHEATITFMDDSIIGSGYDAGAYVSAVIERGNGNVFGFWFKENIPMDIPSYLNNLSRVEFLHRSL